MRRLVLLLCGLICMPAVLGETTAAMQKRTEASMLVTGSIDIAPDGIPSSLALDHRERLPSDVIALIDRASAQWRFAPDPTTDVDASRHASVALRIVGRREDDGTYRNRIRSASFGDRRADSRMRPLSQPSPIYPLFGWQNHIGADVYLLMRLDASGAVTDVSAYQVNLDTVTTLVPMDQIRKLFAEASIKAVKHWTYRLLQPAQTKDGAQLVRVPVHFNAGARHALDLYGQWQVYLPGPKEEVPWLDKYGLAKPALNDDTLPTGTLQPLQSSIALVSPLDAE